MPSNIMIRRCSIFDSNKEQIPNAPDPDPLNFNIIKIQQVGDNLVVLINYPNCTNYEGNKICLFKSMNIKTVIGMDTLDPHFSENDNSPFARFRPTDAGWEKAVLVAQWI